MNASHDQTDPRNIAQRFNQCINDRDLDGLAALMTEDHAFIDSDNNTVTGKEKVLNAWKGFFAAFPDYRNIFDDFRCSGDVVKIIGRSQCSDQRLDGPALWTATVKDKKVAEWRVYEDRPEVRQRLGI